MLAATLTQQNHDLLWAAAITASLSFIGVVVVAWLANQNRKTARNVAQEILDELDTGNGHTAGEALSRLETQMWRHEDRLDSIDIRLREGKETFDEIDAKIVQHEFETRPVRDWVIEQMEQREEQEDG